MMHNENVTVEITQRIEDWASAMILGYFILAMHSYSYAQTATSNSAECNRVLAWDANFKEYHAKTNELASKVTFYVTNISSEAVIVRHLIPSCGCTAAQMPAQPWELSPGASGPISVTTDLRAKRGTLDKTLQVASTAGMDTLQIKILLPEQPEDAAAKRSDRQFAAMADRQAVFKGDCGHFALADIVREGLHG